MLRHLILSSVCGSFKSKPKPLYMYLYLIISYLQFAAASSLWEEREKTTFDIVFSRKICRKILKKFKNSTKIQNSQI